jgi:hypothetical protein
MKEATGIRRSGKAVLLVVWLGGGGSSPVAPQPPPPATGVVSFATFSGTLAAHAWICGLDPKSGASGELTTAVTPPTILLELRSGVCRSEDAGAVGVAI